MQIRKEILIQEINDQKIGENRRFLHRWELRLLLLTLIGGYLYLRAKNESFKEFRWWSWLLSIIIFIASFIYDIQLASLDKRVSDRLDCMYEQLNSLPTMGYYQLENLPRIPPVRKGILKDCKIDSTASVWALRISLITQLDVILFYISVVCLFAIGHLGFKAKDEMRVGK